LELRPFSFQGDVGVSPEIFRNSGFTGKITSECFSQVTGNLLAVPEAAAQICALPQSERTEAESCSEHHRARDCRQLFRALATRLEVEQTLPEANVKLRTQEALALFPKDWRVELHDGNRDPSALSQNKCKVRNVVASG